MVTSAPRPSNGKAEMASQLKEIAGVEGKLAPVGVEGLSSKVRRKHKADLRKNTKNVEHHFIKDGYK